MSLDTELEEDRRRRLEQSPASDAQMAQMAGTGELDDPEPTPDVAPEADSGDQAASPPAPVAENAPESKPTSAVELLAQVKRGQISRPAVDAAFGPPPTPQNEPGASVFAPKMAEAPGIDWKGLSDRLASARSGAASAKTRQNVFANTGNAGKYVEDTRAGDDDVAAAGDEMKIAQAKAAEEKTGAKSQADAAELARRRDLDKWKEMADRMKLTDAAQKEGDLSKEKIRERQNKEAEDQAKRSAADEAAANKKKSDDDRAGLDREKFEWAKAHPKGGGKVAAPPAPVLHEGDLDKVPEDIRPQVAAAIKGQAPIPPAATKNPTQQRIRAFVFQVKPDIDEGAYARRNATVQHMANEGDIRALPVAIHHLDLARKAIESTPEDVSFDSPTLNRMAQAVITGTGGTEFVGPNFGLKVAGDEVAAVYGANTEKKAEAIGKLFDPHATKAQKLRVIEEANRYIGGKVEGAQETIDRVDPGGVSHFNLMTPSVKAALSGGDDSAVVTFKNKKTGKTVRRTKAQLKQADDAADWEATGG